MRHFFEILGATGLTLTISILTMLGYSPNSLAYTVCSGTPTVCTNVEDNTTPKPVPWTPEQLAQGKVKQVEEETQIALDQLTLAAKKDQEAKDAQAGCGNNPCPVADELRSQANEARETGNTARREADAIAGSLAGQGAE